MRAGADVVPGCQLYVAVISDNYGTTFKVGSGKAEARLEELNRYRRVSQGEHRWSIYQHWEFRSTDAARAAEDHLLSRAQAMGHRSKDHSEFVVGIMTRELAELFSEAVTVGEARDAEVEGASAESVVHAESEADVS